jgi:hypothetical protein
MTNNNFTQKQIEKIYELLSFIHDCNNKENSECKIEALEMFKDKHNNFYCSYYFHGFCDGQLCSTIEYIKIDEEGVKTNLKYKYSTTSEIAQRFQSFEKITL